MSADGRTLSDVGHKLLSLKPLAEQAVSASDSVLGAERRPVGPRPGDVVSRPHRAGVHAGLVELERDADARSGRRFSLMEFNFPLFWGLAIQAYEATLVSDQTPADRFFAGDNSALSASAQAGLDVFRGPGRCSTCHLGADLSDATVANVAAVGLTTTDTGLPVDTGFLNIGVRPTASDPGLGGLDPFGNPLSEARRAGATNDNVSGSFKVPQLRNVTLTAPYFHNGGQMTLRQVVDFYSRGGDFANAQQSGVLGTITLTETQKNDLVAFLQSLTDPRVANASAPFDHPQLFVPDGERTGADGAVRKDTAGQALDCFLQVPATGAAGGVPLPQFPAFTGPCVTPPALPGGAGTPAAAAPPASAAAAAAPAAAPRAQVKATKARRVTRCVVPRLTGHTLTAAKRMLRRAHCGLGRVTRAAAHGRRLVVRRQVPSARSRHKSGTRVRLTLRPVAPRRHR